MPSFLITRIDITLEIYDFYGLIGSVYFVIDLIVRRPLHMCLLYRRNLMSASYPSQELIDQFVGNAHGNFQVVKELLENNPSW
jgi:hypothetical protein